MPELTLLQNYLILGAMLFGIGLVGFASRRNMIVMFLSAEMMLQGVSLSLVAWGRWHNDFGGQMLVVFIIAVAACEAAVALALILVMFRRRGSLDIMLWHDLREDNQATPTDARVWDLPAPAPNWPSLPTAGRRPELPQEDTDYRPHV